MEKAEKAQLLRRIRGLREQVDVLTGLIEAIPEPEPRPAPAPVATPNEYLTPKGVQELLDLKPSTFYDMVREGRLPQGYLISPRRQRWRRDEIENAIRQMKGA